MAPKKPSTSGAPTPIGAGLNPPPVTELNPHDVLLGRGSGSNDWIGNQHFRDIVKLRSKEYTSTEKHKRKKEIAKEVLDCIRAAGGRFLRHDENVESVYSIVEDGTWYECDENASLEKCKQALRQHRPDASERQPNTAKVDTAYHGDGDVTENHDDVDPTENQSTFHGTSSHFVFASSFGMDGGMVVDPPSLIMSLQPFMTSILPPGVDGSSAPPAALDRRLLPFQQAPFAFQPYHPLLLSQGSVIPGLNSLPVQAHLQTGPLPSKAQPDNSYSGNEATTVAQQQHPRLCVSSPAQAKSMLQDHIKGRDVNDVAVGLMPKSDSPAVTVDDGEVSEYLLSVLALSGRPKFTNQQDAQEQASMTDDERARVLCDLFGKYCSTHQTKKARRDLSMDEVSFLVKQMRIEIERIPEDEKDALMKAKVKCTAQEFSDARLERFLRCEGMDVKVRAGLLVYHAECHIMVVT